MATHHHKGKGKNQDDPAKRPQSPRRKQKPESVLRRRWRKRLTAIAVILVVVNGLTWLLVSDWRTRWIMLTVSLLAVPVLITVFWDPEGRGQLGDL
jgi:hypothetical protein